MNILIIEDDKIVAQSLSSILKKIDGANIVQQAHSFQEGFTKAMSDIFDIIIVDIHLGDGQPSGIELCKTIRKSNKEIPIIMVTALHSIGYLEKAFNEGANDYITKPFNIKELKIRTKRWMQFSHKFHVNSNIEYGELQYNPNNNTFALNELEIRLTKKEKALLLLFITQPEKILTPLYLQEKLWGDYEEIKGRNIRSNIQKLREALKIKTNNKYSIENIRGEGYLLKKH